MKVLIGCEESGVVRRAFRALGHEAWSCDILPARDGSPHHFTGDLADVLPFHTTYNPTGFDLAIFHPPCTVLTVAANRWQRDHWVRRNGCKDAHAHALAYLGATLKHCANGCRWHDGAEHRAERPRAVAFFRMCLEAKIPRVAVENPVGVISSIIRPPDQYVEPWQFGHGELKKIGLWLKNLPPLRPTNVVEGREQRVWKMPPGPNRKRARSETYAGIASAMAQQWGSL